MPALRAVKLQTQMPLRIVGPGQHRYAFAYCVLPSCGRLRPILYEEQDWANKMFKDWDLLIMDILYNIFYATISQAPFVSTLRTR